jgi:hypothetical protein
MPAVDPGAWAPRSLTVARCSGRLRRRQYLLLLALAGCAGWLWIAAIGTVAIPIVVAAGLWARGRPGRSNDPSLPLLRLHEDAVRGARMDSWRVLIRSRDGCEEIFRDELNAADWAALRRWVKALDIS